MPINHQANDKREADWIATTKKKWAKAKTVKNNIFWISTHNRFSYWEEEVSNEPVFSMIGEIQTEKIKVVEGMTKENKVKVETICAGLNFFETKRSQKFTEAEIKPILRVKSKTVIMGEDFPENVSKKVKCRQCGHKKNCKEPNRCKAVNKLCSFCFKPNHFPKSLNCKKKRKLKQKRRYDNLTSGCQTLREFLASKIYKLSPSKVPYQELLDTDRKQTMINKINENRIILDERTIEEICQKIKYIERKLQFEKTFETTPKGTLFFCGVYILYNLHFYFLDNLGALKRSKDTDYSENNIACGWGLPDEVENFLEISSGTTHCLENYVVEKLTPDNNCVPWEIHDFEPDVSFRDVSELRKKRIEKYTRNIREQIEGLDEMDFSECFRNTTSSPSSDNMYSFPLLGKGDLSPIPQTDAVSFQNVSPSSPFSPVNLQFENSLEIEDNENKSCQQESNVTDTSSSSVSSYGIVQLDGLTDDPFIGLAGINCDDPFLSSVITVFRSFEGVWRNFDDHQLCMVAKSKTGHRCLFCQMRSLSLRLNRAKIKVNLKPVEILSQQDQLPNHESFATDFKGYFYKVLEKIVLYEEKLKDIIFGTTLVCQKCSVRENLILNATIEDMSQVTNPSVDNILTKLIENVNSNHAHTTKCANPCLKSDGHEKVIVMTFEVPNQIVIPNEIFHEERKFKLACQVQQNEESGLKCSFTYQGKIYTHEHLKPPKRTESISNKNVLLVVYKLSIGKNDIWQVEESPITYKHNSLANMNRRLKMFVSPEKYKKRKLEQQDQDQNRDKTPKRKDEHKLIDQNRDKTPKRKDEHKLINQNRDKTPKRKEDHKVIDQNRD